MIKDAKGLADDAEANKLISKEIRGNAANAELILNGEPELYLKVVTVKSLLD